MTKLTQKLQITHFDVIRALRCWGQFAPFRHLSSKKKVSPKYTMLVSELALKLQKLRTPRLARLSPVMPLARGPPTKLVAIGYVRVPTGLCISLWYGNDFFFPMQIKLFFTRKVVHLASFWKWAFLELRSGLLWCSRGIKVYHLPECQTFSKMRSTIPRFPSARFQLPLHQNMQL